MYNLIHAEFYKWKKSKSFLVCLLSAIGIILFVYFMLNVASEVQKGKLKNGTGGIIVSGKLIEEQNGDILKQIGILEMISQIISSGTGSIFSAIFICIWIVSEYSHGAIKNTAGKGYIRGKVFLAKYLSTTMSILLMNLIMVIVTLLIGFVTIGTEDVDKIFFQNFFSYVALQLLFNIAFGSIVMVICECIRNMAASIGISIFLISFSPIIISGMDMLFQALHLKLKVSDYWILSVMNQCPIEGITMEFIIRGIVVAIMWIVLSLVLGMIHFKKADIK